MFNRHQKVDFGLLSTSNNCFYSRDLLAPFNAFWSCPSENFLLVVDIVKQIWHVLGVYGRDACLIVLGKKKKLDKIQVSPRRGKEEKWYSERHVVRRRRGSVVRSSVLADGLVRCGGKIWIRREKEIFYM